MKYVNVVFGKKALKSVCGQQQIALKMFELFEGIHGTPFANNSTQFNITLSKHWGTHLILKDVYLGICLPHYLVTLVFHVCIYF